MTLKSDPTMTGRVRDDRRTVDTDDATLAALHAAGGLVFVIDSRGDWTSAELVHDGAVFVVRCQASLASRIQPQVELRVRGARS